MQKDAFCKQRNIKATLDTRKKQQTDNIESACCYYMNGRDIYPWMPNNLAKINFLSEPDQSIP